MSGYLEAEVKYYCREKFYGKVQKVIKQNLSRNSNDAVSIFYNGLSLVLSGRYQEGIRELDEAQTSDDLSLAITMCLIHAHKRSPSVDKETVQQLEMKMKEFRKSTTPLSMFYAALFFFFTDRFDKASDIISKILKIDSNFSQGVVLKGWIDMCKNVNNLTQKIADCFERNDDDLDALLGLITFKYLQKDYTSAIIMLDNTASKYPQLELILIEKMKNELALFNWDQVMDLADIILNKDLENIHGMKYRILLTICKRGDYIEATDLLVKYFDMLERHESKNSEIFYDSAKLFSCICGRFSSILSQTYRYIKYAAELQPTNVEYLTELGFQCLMQNMLKDAVHFFKSATKVDDNSINALLGLTMCQMAEHGPSEQVEQQIELLNELMGGNQKNSRLLLMSAKLEHKNPDRAIGILIDCSNAHISKSHYIPFGFEYLKFLNPDFVLEVIDEFLRYAPKRPMVILDRAIVNFEEVLPVVVVQCFKLLEILIMSCPGLASAVYRLSKLQFQHGKVDEAIQNAQNIVDNIDQSFANAYLLLAQIYVHQNQLNKTEQNLEICLSYNFKVRDNPMYHLLQGIVMKSKKKYTEALACYTSSLNLIEAKLDSGKRARSDIDTSLILADKATLYLELISAYSLLDQYSEADKIMQTAVQEFALTTEEPRLTIANAELALNAGDVDKCLELLSQVKPEQSYYLQARTKLAHVYLKEKNDRNMFASCFKELVANHPGYDAQIMLGDAYLSIHEPAHAVEAFQKALEQNPHDLSLIKKMGVALVKMHLYDKAVKHYIDAIEVLNSPEIKIELAELYFKLKKYDKAVDVLKVEIENPNNYNSMDTTSMKFQTKVLMMLAKVKERNPREINKKATLITLKDARENQTRLVKRAQLESHPDLDEEKKLLCEICAQLATQYANNKAIDQAIQTYKEALQYNPQHPPILLALANLYMQSNEPELCQQTCSILLSTAPENEAASVMMAELAFRKVDFETASFHLKQLLTSQPAYWTALEKLIDVQRRLGNLEEVSSFLTKAQEDGYGEEPGYLYCAGLYARYTGDPNVALRHWGRARRAEGRWGRSAALGVVKVCMSPGGEALPPPINEDGLMDPNEDAEYRDTRSFALSMAERLLNELQNSGSYDAVEALELRLLGIRLTIAGRKKASVESALKIALQMASEDGSADDIGVAVTIASAQIVLKQTQRARNQLKRVSRIPWTPEKAEWLEMCWILLAECLMTAGNTASNVDAAKDCLERALKHNKSCTQAYECFGYLAEKDQLYKEAADYYENAWKYGGLGNASIGYKYALCLLKAKKYAQAIYVSRDVLTAHPDCPKIRKDVMEKASSLLRM